MKVLFFVEIWGDIFDLDVIVNFVLIMLFKWVVGFLFKDIFGWGVMNLKVLLFFFLLFLDSMLECNFGKFWLLL